MRKITVMALIILFFIPIGISARDYAYNSDMFADKGSPEIFADNPFGDYFLFSRQQTISLDLENARLIDVLKMLSQQTGLNFISTEAVKGRRITLYLQNTPFKKAMDIVFKANNLNYDFYPEAEIFVIKEMGKPATELKTKIYHLKYARVMNSNMQSEIDQILKATEESDSEGEEGGGGLGQTNEKTGIKEVIEQSLSELGRASVNSASNSIIVVDVPSQFPIIEDVINRLDIPPQKVMIEVEILDVSKDVVDKLGFKYGGDAVDGIAGSFQPFPDTFSPNKGPIPWRTSIFDFTDIDIFAQLYKQDTTAKILARPRIMTLNNETAEIDIITDEVVGVKIDRDVETGSLESKEERRISDVSNFKGAGVTLRVTPQINSLTDEITLIIYPSVVDTSDSSFTDEEGVPYKNIQDRSTRSVVRLRDGETLLLGGLIKNDDKETVTKIPFLSDIPLLGALFRHKSTAGTGDRELMVFLTPKIIEDTSFRRTKGSAAILKREQLNLGKESAVNSVLNKHMDKRRD
jgi:type IV pilus assembly protein PilQ